MMILHNAMVLTKMRWTLLVILVFMCGCSKNNSYSADELPGLIQEEEQGIVLENKNITNSVAESEQPETSVLPSSANVMDKVKDSTTSTNTTTGNASVSTKNSTSVSSASQEATSSSAQKETAETETASESASASEEKKPTTEKAESTKLIETPIELPDSSPIEVPKDPVTEPSDNPDNRVIQLPAL